MDNQDYVIDQNGAWGNPSDALLWYQKEVARLRGDVTCKTCAFWIDPANVARDTEAELTCHPLDQDTFEPMVFNAEVRVCKHPAQTFSERPVERDGFGVIDGSNYYARLLTAEAFGCVRHST